MLYGREERESVKYETKCIYKKLPQSSWKVVIMCGGVVAKGCTAAVKQIKGPHDKSSRVRFVKKNLHEELTE